MKYVIIIADGGADFPLPQLDGRTPFAAARKPNTDRISIEGRQGIVATTPDDMPCGSDICCMSLLGYDPAKYHTGRAPIEAASLGIELGNTDWAFRANLVTVADHKMLDHSAGHISNAEAYRLLTEFSASQDWSGMTFIPGVSYRNILVDTSGQHDWSALSTTPPHDIPGESINQYLPNQASHRDVLLQLMNDSESFFTNHEVNITRRQLGEPPATQLWIWGQGRKPHMNRFEQRFGLRGAMITAVDLLAGLARLIGWDRLDVPDQTSYHDTDYAAAGSAAIKALASYDIVCVHVESPDEASHAADAKTKVEAIESIDQHIVGPLLETLSHAESGFRMLYMPDHYTAVSTRKHDPTPVPFAMCGRHVNSVLQQPFTEANAKRSDLHIKYGHELIEYFLRSGQPEK